MPPILIAVTIISLADNFAAPENSRLVANWLLSLVPPSMQLAPNTLNGIMRKGWHILIYATIYYFWFRALAGYWGLARGRALGYALGLCLVVALLDEGRQSLFSSREGKIADVVLDMTAASGAALITTAVKALARKTD